MKKFWLAALGCAAMSFLAPGAYADSTYDLVNNDSASDTDGNAEFVWIDAQSTGTGVIDSFVRLATNPQNADGGDSSAGLNTNGRPLANDENSSPQFTHEIKLEEIPIVDLGGTDYREFLLDINQTNADSLLSLIEIEIYLLNEGNDSLTTLQQLKDQGTLVWSLDTTGDDTIELDYARNAGSGAGDMFLYVKDSLFTGDEGQQVYLWSKFGVPGDNNTNDGFEEWAVRLAEGSDDPDDDPVPEPGTFALVALCAAGAVVMRRRKNAQQ